MTVAATTQVFQIYISDTAERVWETIATPEGVSRFFQGARVEGTYEAGNRVRTSSPDGERVWGDNEILEVDPPKRLVHTWRSLYDNEMAAEGESRVTWEIEELPGEFCKVTVIHDRLEHAPKTAASIQGWFYYLSSLKSVLETGSPLPPFPL